MLIEFAPREHPFVAITPKNVIPVETGIQKVLKEQIPWAPAFAGVTIQFNKWFSHGFDQ